MLLLGALVVVGNAYAQAPYQNLFRLEYNGITYTCSGGSDCYQAHGEYMYDRGQGSCDVAGVIYGPGFITGPTEYDTSWMIAVTTFCEIPAGGGTYGPKAFSLPKAEMDPECYFQGTELLCEAPCDESITGQAFLRPVFSGGSTGDICHESSGCVMSAGDTSGLPGGDLVEYTGTSQSCSAEPDVPVDESDKQPQCITSGGNQWCSEPNLADQNCGMLNGEYLCLDAIPDGECTFYGNGSLACDPAAGSPPAPDDGVTAGIPAAPDITLNNNGTPTNVYGSGTVGSSSSPTTGSSQPDGGIGEEQTDTGSGTASGSCSVAPACAGDAIQCAILEQQWYTACQEPGTEGEILANTGLSAYTDVEGSLASSVGLDTSLDEAGFLTTRECLIDIPVDLGYFGSYTLAFSQWCPLFSFVGVLVLISAGIASLRIIAGAF